MPMRDIRRIYTKSEIMLMGWRSQEMAHNMRHKPSQDGPRNPNAPNHQPTPYNRTTGRPDGATGPMEDLGEGKAEQVNLFQAMPEQGVSDAQLRFIERSLGESVITKMVNRDGDVDLRRLTGDEALRYMRTMGVPLVTMSPQKRYVPPPIDDKPEFSI